MANQMTKERALEIAAAMENLTEDQDAWIEECAQLNAIDVELMVACGDCYNDSPGAEDQAMARELGISVEELLAYYEYANYHPHEIPTEEYRWEEILRDAGDL